MGFQEPVNNFLALFILVCAVGSILTSMAAKVSRKRLVVETKTERSGPYEVRVELECDVHEALVRIADALDSIDSKTNR